MKKRQKKSGYDRRKSPGRREDEEKRMVEILFWISSKTILHNGVLEKL